MKNLKVGDKYICTNNVIMENGQHANKIVYYKDTIYNCDKEDCLTDEYGNQYHRWCDPEFDQHFKEVETFSVPVYPLPPAVLVQNEREFKALMEDFEKKAFRWYSTNAATDELPSSYDFPCAITLQDRFIALEKEEYECYNIISFSTYALIAGIELPIETKLDEGATVTLSENRFEFDESVMSLSFNDVRNLYNLIP